MTGEDNIRRALQAYTPRERGDHSLNPDMPPLVPRRTAAVLVPLVQRNDGLTVLFTQRGPHLNAHAGQVSFPGGRVDETDSGPMAAALREAEEEIGLSPGNVAVLGTLDRYITRSGYAVTPVVGLVSPPSVWTPHSFEVDAIFEVPLPDILRPDMLIEDAVEFDGRLRRFYAMQWQEYRIWGATAGMLHNFIDVVKNA